MSEHDELLEASKGLLKTLDFLLHDYIYTGVESILDSLHEGGHYNLRDSCEKMFGRIAEAERELRRAVEKLEKR